MKIRTRIFLTFLAMALLIAAVGGFTVNRLRGAVAVASAAEAEHVARALGFGLLTEDKKFIPHPQEVIQRLHRTMQRDVALVDRQQHILADAVPAAIGTTYDGDPNDEIGLTITDRRVRTFVEKSEEHPEGMKQVVVAVEAPDGEVPGAIVMEYTPLYDELMNRTVKTMREVVLIAVASSLIAACLTLYMGRSIAAPLHRLTEAARHYALGFADFRMPPRGADEIGELAEAFGIMIEKRKEASDALKQTLAEVETRVIERTAQLAEANTHLQLEISERLHAVQETQKLTCELARERLRLDGILDSIPAVVFENPEVAAIFEPAERGIAGKHYVNGHVEQMYGFTREEWLSSRSFWFSCVHPDDREKVLNNTSRRLSRQKTLECELFRWVKKDGSVVWGETYLVPLRDLDGAVIGVRGVTLDVTMRVAAEARLAEANKQLLRSSHQAGMAEVATSVLHNVGNAMNSVNISLGLAAERVGHMKIGALERVVSALHEHRDDLITFLTKHPQGARLPSFLGQLAEHFVVEQKAALAELQLLRLNIEHINEIVAMQQDYATAGGLVETLPLAEVVEDALRMNLAALQRHGTQIAREFDLSLPAIPFDRNKVLMILFNLIRNAKYACDEGLGDEKRVVVRTERGDGRQARILVSDNGVGIPAENLTRIFEHGFTTRKNGHGFGLHSSALAAREMGGELSVQSSGHGQGATFVLELPIPDYPS